MFFSGISSFNHRWKKFDFSTATSCSPRDENAQKITDIFYNTHLSLDTLYDCMCVYA